MNVTRLREIRLSLSLSVREFANVLGVDDATICDWESGKSRPTYGQERFLADLLRLLERDLAKT